MRERQGEKHPNLFRHTREIVKFWINSEKRLRKKLFSYLFRYYEEISIAKKQQVVSLEDEMRKHREHSEEEKTKFFL